MKQALFLVFWLSAAGLCGATDIYKWKDEAGHTHVADSVPERYRKVATKIDSRQFEVRADDRAAALARSAKELERAAAMAADRARTESDASGLAPSGSGPRAQPKQGESECDRLWRTYLDSQRCFAPYQRRQGGTRVEAYSHCEPVQAPPAECGPAKVIEGN